MKKQKLAVALCLLATIATALGSGALYTQTQRLERGRKPVLPSLTLQSRPDNLFGINVALLNVEDSERDAALDLIAESGFGWIRQEFPWNELQPGADHFEWQAADGLIAAAYARRLQVIALLQITPSWARSSNAADIRSAPPEDPEDFASFAAAFAARYAENIDVYQIWDEPNLASGWGGQPPNAAAYTRLLAAGYAAIHTKDEGATVLLAGLAPTIETGQENLSDLLFLNQLYEQGAQAFFDAAAAKPYGFATHPADRDADSDVLNFSRMILMREAMVAAGDENALLWASNFGWNHLPVDWSGQPSVWDFTSAEEQAWRTLAAFERARNEWPWTGVLVLENFQPATAFDDPRWGFSLVASDGESSQTHDILADAMPQLSTTAPPGVYTADTRFAEYEGAWKFSALGADIPLDGPSEITFEFEGTEIGIIARRDNYRAYLYAQIDGLPANALPIDADGEAYAVLTSGDYLPHTETIWLAQGLNPGKHTATIQADRGWNQWAIAGFIVGNDPQTTSLIWGYSILFVLALGGAYSTGYLLWRGDLLPAQSVWAATLGKPWQMVATATLAGLVWASAWLTWGTETTQAIRRYGDSTALLLTLISAGVFYFSPWLLVTLLSMIGLFVAILLRPQFALPLVAFFAPFYLLPRPLLERAFSLVEVVTLMATSALTLHFLARGMTFLREKKSLRAGLSSFATRFTGLDQAVLAFAAISLVATAFAENRAVAVTEFRTMIAEPLVIYALLRVLRLGEFAVWRTVDFWILGGALVAVIGLVQFFSGTNLITAEGGVTRLRSVYGSPNNVGLYLGRLIPIALSFALLGLQRRRRILYGAAAAAMGSALGLSLSRGALLLGVPAALATVLLFWQGKRAAYALAGLATAGMIALVPLSRHPRFAELLNLSTGPTFFRLNLWRSAINIVRDNPLTGVGLDNFLYAYRGRYILPAAWQDPSLSHAHNLILDFATRLGLPGLAIALWMLIELFRNLWRGLRNARNRNLYALTVGLLGSLIDFLAHGLVDASYWFIDLSFTFMLTAGLIAWLTNQAAAPIEEVTEAE